MLVVSVPASGSVMPNDTCRLPSAAGRRKRSRCSSLPYLTIGSRPNSGDLDGRTRVERPAAAGDLLEQQRRFLDARAAAAVLLRDAHADPAGLRHRLVEVPRELVVQVVPHPVLVRELRQHLAQRRADLALVLRTHHARSHGHSQHQRIHIHDYHSYHMRLASDSNASCSRVQVDGAGVPGEHGRALVARQGRARGLGDLAHAGVGGRLGGHRPVRTEDQPGRAEGLQRDVDVGCQVRVGPVWRRDGLQARQLARDVGFVPRAPAGQRPTARARPRRSKACRGGQARTAGRDGRAPLPGPPGSGPGGSPGRTAARRRRAPSGCGGPRAIAASPPGRPRPGPGAGCRPGAPWMSERKARPGSPATSGRPSRRRRGRCSTFLAQSMKSAVSPASLMTCTRITPSTGVPASAERRSRDVEAAPYRRPGRDPRLVTDREVPQVQVRIEHGRRWHQFKPCL